MHFSVPDCNLNYCFTGHVVSGEDGLKVAVWHTQSPDGPVGASSIMSKPSLLLAHLVEMGKGLSVSDDVRDRNGQKWTFYVSTAAGRRILHHRCQSYVPET